MVIAIRTILPPFGTPGPDPEEAYPFLTSSEFPSITGEDRDNLEAATHQFLQAPKWQKEFYGEFDISFDSAIPLTPGRRASRGYGLLDIWPEHGHSSGGGYGLVRDGSKGFTETSFLVVIEGLRVDLLDGQRQPYSVRPIPTDEEGFENKVRPGVMQQVREACAEPVSTP